MIRSFHFFAAAGLAVGLADASHAVAAPSCKDPGTGWCVALRISGDVPGGELGFRFGEPLDADGDGRADIAAGSRFKYANKTDQNGIAIVWSGATGAKIREWDGTLKDGLFGHSMLPIPDLDGDGLADVVVSAPNAKADDLLHGVVSARSPKTGEVLWRKIAKRQETLGWHMALAGDQNSDGKTDIFAGAPYRDGGRVYLLSGADGAVLRMYEAEAPCSTFGWTVARTDDFDADGHADLVVGAFTGDSYRNIGAAFLISANTGALLKRWDGENDISSFAETVASLGDLDGDGKGEIAVSAAYSTLDENSHPGDVIIYSGVTGAPVRRWRGKQNGEYYGRMIVSAGDIDGDGIDDVAVGAPSHKVSGAVKVGRVDIRSGKNGDILAEWFGEGAESWFGWHIRKAPDPEGKGRPALLIGSLRQPVNGQEGVGVIDLYVKRP